MGILAKGLVKKSQGETEKKRPEPVGRPERSAGTR